MEGLISCFDGLKDDRACNARRDDLLELLVIALCTFLGGGESCVDTGRCRDCTRRPFATGRTLDRRAFAGCPGQGLGVAAEERLSPARDFCGAA
jgi:hypothetical protein